MMYQELSLRDDSGECYQWQCLAKSLPGRRCPAALTRISKSLSNSHRHMDKVGGRESGSRRPLHCRRPQMSGNWDGVQPTGRNTRILCSSEQRVAKLKRSPVRHCKEGGSTLPMPERPQEAHPADTHNKMPSVIWPHPNQPRRDLMAGSLQLCSPDIQRSSQPIHEECQRSRSLVALSNNNARIHPSASMRSPDCLSSTHHVPWNQALVGPHRDR